MPNDPTPTADADIFASALRRDELRVGGYEDLSQGVRPSDENRLDAPARSAEVIVRPRHRRAQSGRSRQAQRAIEEAIKERILLDRLQTGDPIPTESEFVEELGISRNSVREALKALQAVDIVEIRHGYGTYVGGGSLDPLADALVFRGRKALHDTREINEIVDVREALEVGFIGHVATIIDRAELDRLADRLEDLRIHAGPGDAGERADRAFHDELYAPLRNQLMSQLLRVFWDVYHALSPQLSVAPQDRIDIIAGHEAIYAAVAAHDAENATVAMRKHFAGIRHRLDGALTSQGLSRR